MPHYAKTHNSTCVHTSFQTSSGVYGSASALFPAVLGLVLFLDPPLSLSVEPPVLDARPMPYRPPLPVLVADDPLNDPLVVLIPESRNSTAPSSSPLASTLSTLWGGPRRRR